MRRLVACLLAVGATLPLARPARAEGSPDVVVAALEQELHRSMKELALPGMPPPYFIAYTVEDAKTTHAGATFGALVGPSAYRTRQLRVEVRVGDPSLDNGNYSGGFDFPWSREDEFPLSDDPDVIRHAAWIATDRAYKKALEALEKKKAERQGDAANPDDVGSFSKETPGISKPLPPLPEFALPDGLVRKLSGVFRSTPAIQSDRVDAATHTGWSAFISSEGARVFDAQSWVTVDVRCETQANDGMKLAGHFEALARDPRLLSEDELMTRARSLAEELTRAREAPVVDDVTGPVLFEGEAAPLLVRDVLAGPLGGTPPVEGNRFLAMRGPEGLRSRLGQRILPKGFSVVDDPTTNALGKLPLFGDFAFDDEGVASQRVRLVDDGILKTLLMSRTPIKPIPHSNGHGRLGAMAAGTARGQAANLIVSASRGIAPAALKKRLLVQMSADGAAHGYIVRAFSDPLSSAFAFGMSARAGERPLYLVEVDKSGKERLVRGGTLPTIAVRSFKDIVASGNEPSVLSSLWFVTSGGQMTAGPVSVASPALLLRDVEIKKSTGAQPKPPVVPHPFFAVR